MSCCSPPPLCQLCYGVSGASIRRSIGGAPCQSYELLVASGGPHPRRTPAPQSRTSVDLHQGGGDRPHVYWRMLALESPLRAAHPASQEEPAAPKAATSARPHRSDHARGRRGACHGRKRRLRPVSSGLRDDGAGHRNLRGERRQPPVSSASAGRLPDPVQTGGDVPGHGGGAGPACCGRLRALVAGRGAAPLAQRCRGAVSAARPAVATSHPPLTSD